MRNLKRFLAVVVTIAMVAMFSISAFAAVPSDVKGTEYESAVTRLAALGILTGYPDGTFGPNDTITRAQFAAVVVRALGYTSAAAAQSTTKFADVPVTYWASGYINLATTLGVIKGYPDGKFGPEDKVTYEQAITMIVRALGYEPAAAAQGGFPTGYMVIASQEDIDQDVNGVIGAPASRGIVAQLMDNALEVDLMEQVTYGTDSNFEKQPGKTLLTEKLKLDKFEKAAVKSVDTGDRKVKLTYDDGNKTVTKNYDVFESVSMAGLEDAIVTFWAKDDVIYNIDFDSTTVYDFIAEVNGDDTAFDPANAEDITSIKLDVLDDEYDAQDGGPKMIDDHFTASDLIGAYAKVVINDGEIISVEPYTVKDGGIITAADDKAITYTQGDSEDKRIRNLNDADSILVVIDGKVAELTDLKADMYFDYYKASSGDADYVFVASSAKVEGQLSKAKDTKLSIDGEYTDLAAPAYFSTDNGDGYDQVTKGAEDFGDLLKLSVSAYLDNHGDIKYIKGEGETTTDDFYGIAIKVSTFDDKIKVTRDVDGSEDDVTYATDLDDDSLTLDDVTADLALNDRTAAFYKFTFDQDNVITKIERPDMTNKTVASFNEDGDYIDAAGSKVYVDDDTLIFDVTPANDIKVLKWADIQGTDISSGDGVQVYYDSANPDYVLLDDNGAVDFNGGDYYLGFVLSADKENVDDYTYSLATNGDQTDFLVDKGERSSSTEAQVVVYQTTSESGRIEIKGKFNFTQLVNGSSPADTALNNFDSGWHTVSGEVYKDGVDGKYLTIGASETTYRVASDAIIYKFANDGTMTDIDDYSEASLSDINDENTYGALSDKNDKVYGITVDGQIKVLFIQEQ